MCAKRRKVFKVETLSGGTRCRKHFQIPLEVLESEKEAVRGAVQSQAQEHKIANRKQAQLVKELKMEVIRERQKFEKLKLSKSRPNSVSTRSDNGSISSAGGGGNAEDF